MNEAVKLVTWRWYSDIGNKKRFQLDPMGPYFGGICI